MPDFKLEAARSALPYIKKGAIGFGAGATIRNLITLINEDSILKNSIICFSPSFSTRSLLIEKGFELRDISLFKQLDLYLDGCDQFDRDLNALKSGGGIHCMEKLFAAMAEEFMLLGDAPKYVARFDGSVPVVAEVIPEAFSYIHSRLMALFPGAAARLRMNDKREGPVLTEHGNYLVDILFQEFPEVSRLNNQLGCLPGMLAHSLFYQMAHRAVIAGPDGVRLIEKNSSKSFTD